VPRVPLDRRGRECVKDVDQGLRDFVVRAPRLQCDPNQPGQRVEVVLGELVGRRSELLEGQIRPGEVGECDARGGFEPRGRQAGRGSDGVVEAGEHRGVERAPGVGCRGAAEQGVNGFVQGQDARLLPESGCERAHRTAPGVGVSA
jgi:hypothetical protein